MSDYVYLSGAEDVQRAGNKMREAGEKMERAASEIVWAVERLEQLVRNELLPGLAQIAEGVPDAD